MNSVSGFYFDTVNTIIAACEEKRLRSCMRLCAHYEQLFSKTIPGSDVWRLNHAEGRQVQVCAEMRQLLETSLEIYKASNGAFNIAVGALMELWNFRMEKPSLPEAAQVQAAFSDCDTERIIIDGPVVRIPANMRIDLGGIAKGFIADQVGAYLKSSGVESALLNFGGNIVAIGPKEDGTSWKIGLQSPCGTWGKDYWAVTELSIGTIVTSGIYERGFELNGRRYHHVLDPTTGWPTQNGLVSVTIRGKNSMIADALATAVLVLDAPAGFALAEAYSCQAIALYDDGREWRTPNFPLLCAVSEDRLKASN